MAVTIIGFALGALALVGVALIFLQPMSSGESPTSTYVDIPVRATIEVVDESGSHLGITARMQEYIANLEADLRELGLTPTRAVVPAGAIREVDFYLDGVTGRIKTTIDRGAGVTAEDAERMLRYLASQGVNEFEYIDVRIDGKAYWK